MMWSLLYTALTIAAASQGRNPARDTYPRVTFDDHVRVMFARDTYIELRARFAAEHRASDAPLETGEDAFAIVRKRAGVAGEVGGVVAFEVERELSGVEPWRDVFVEYIQFDAARLKAGKFKLPFGMEENTSIDNLDLVRRSMVSNELAPGRDVGVMLHGELLGRRLNYEAGIFEKDGMNARPRQPEQRQGGRSFAGRVVLQPARGSKSAFEDLEVGGAFMQSELEEGLSALHGQTALGRTFFPSDFWVRGQRRRTGLQARLRRGPIGVKSEYIRATDERLGMSVEDTDLPPLEAIGWYITGTWVLTGEDEQDADVPRRPLFRGGLGSIKLAVRTERLEFGSDGEVDDASTSPRADVILPNAVRAHTAGISWQPNRWIKLQFNVIHETLDDPSRGPFPSRASYWSRIAFAQVSL